MTPLTFREFEARAGELIGRRAFGARSTAQLRRQALLLRQAADDIEMCARLFVQDAPAPSDLAGHLGQALGQTLLHAAALANELGLPLESLVAAELRRRARCPTVARLAGAGTEAAPC